MTRKYCFRIGILVIFSLVILRSSMIAIPLTYPNLVCYDGDFNAINLDEETSDRLIASAKACRPEFPYNPLGFGDYLGVFFFGKSIDPSISIVDLRRDGAGYRVAFYGYKDGYRATFHLSEAFEVIVAGVGYKTKM